MWKQYLKLTDTYTIYVREYRSDLLSLLSLSLDCTNKGNNKITEHRAIFQRKVKIHKSINRQQPGFWETAMALTTKMFAMTRNPRS